MRNFEQISHGTANSIVMPSNDRKRDMEQRKCQGPGITLNEKLESKYHTYKNTFKVMLDKPQTDEYLRGIMVDKKHYPYHFGKILSYSLIPPIMTLVETAYMI